MQLTDNAIKPGKPQIMIPIKTNPGSPKHTPSHPHVNSKPQKQSPKNQHTNPTPHKLAPQINKKTSTKKKQNKQALLRNNQKNLILPHNPYVNPSQKNHTSIVTNQNSLANKKNPGAQTQLLSPFAIQPINCVLKKQSSTRV